MPYEEQLEQNVREAQERLNDFIQDFDAGIDRMRLTSLICELIKVEIEQWVVKHRLIHFVGED